MYQRTYNDDELGVAIANSHSWRGVLRSLGLKATSAGSARSVKRHADRIGLSTSHFTGQRRWTETQLRHALATKSTWVEVANALGLAPGGGATTALQAHAVRLGVSTEHLAAKRPRPAAPLGLAGPIPSRLRDAGSFMAAAWFTLHGARVMWPLEPCRYDLVADIDSDLRRIQVKTTSATGPTALVMVSNSRRRGRAVYAPDEIDSFFIVDGELTAYLIPYEVVAGYTQLKLSHYVNFKVVVRGDLLSAASSP